MARYLTKGRPIAIDGRLERREYNAQDRSKRQALQIIADAVQFLASPERAPNDHIPAPARAHPVTADDDIPF